MAIAEPGNTEGMNNMCVEFPVADRRLHQWADWLHEQPALKQLGYQSCSPEQKQPGSGGKHELYKPNPTAEQTEQILSEMKQRGDAWKAVYQSILAYYFLGKSIRGAADHNCISINTYQKYLTTGLAWVEAKLT